MWDIQSFWHAIFLHRIHSSNASTLFVCENNWLRVIDPIFVLIIPKRIWFFMSNYTFWQLLQCLAWFRRIECCFGNWLSSSIRLIFISVISPIHTCRNHMKIGSVKWGLRIIWVLLFFIMFDRYIRLWMRNMRILTYWTCDSGCFGLILRQIEVWFCNFNWWLECWTWI